MDNYGWEWLTQRVGVIEGHEQDMLRRIANLEVSRDKQAFDEHALKSRAAAAQATEHLYAPLRSDTQPLIDMAAFVRSVADMQFKSTDPLFCWQALTGLITEAREILKRST